MAFVKRYHIENSKGRFWTGAEYTQDERCAVEYRDRDEAEEDAFEFDGEVVEFERFSPFPDPQFSPFTFLQAAE